MRVIYILFVSVWFLSCDNIGNRTAYEANKYKHEFPELTDHFPKCNDCNVKSYSFIKSTEYFPNSGKSIAIEYSYYSLDSLIAFEQIIKEKAISIFSSSTKDSVYKSKPNFDGIILHDNKIPIPFMMGPKFSLEIASGHFPVEYKHYVIESRQGIFLKENEIIDDGIVPSPWEHGMVRGITVNKTIKKLIVWISIW